MFQENMENVSSIVIYKTFEEVIKRFTVVSFSLDKCKWLLKQMATNYHLSESSCNSIKRVCVYEKIFNTATTAIIISFSKFWYRWYTDGILMDIAIIYKYCYKKVLWE